MWWGEERGEDLMKKKLKILVALLATITMIAIGQRSQTVQNNAKTQKAQIEGRSADTDAWFI